jgi:hypothetical protein
MGYGCMSITYKKGLETKMKTIINLYARAMKLFF